MARKLFTLGIAFVVVAVIWLNQKASPVISDGIEKKEVIEVTQKDSQLADGMLVEQIAEEDSKAAVEETADILAAEDSLLLEMVERRFSDDPIVEMESLVFEHIQCMPDFEKIMIQGSITSDAALVQLDEAKKACDRFKQKYPLISNMKDLKKHIDSLVPSSRYGQLRKTPDRNSELVDKTVNLVLAAIQTKSGPVIAINGITMQFTLMRAPNPEWQQLLQATHVSYISYISTLAMQKLSCRYQDAISCSKNGILMFQKCVTNESYCGMDFQTWYNQFTLPGQRKDVELMLQFLLDQASDE